MDKETQEMQITLRPAREDDKAFCRQVHHLAYRDVVMRQFGAWDEQQQDGFFAEAWNEFQPNIIETDGQPVGCFYCETHPDEMLLLDISILPAFQGHGIASDLIRREQREAARQGVPMRLRVLKQNDAQRLYRRLGFKQTGEDATHFLMEWQSSGMK